MQTVSVLIGKSWSSQTERFYCRSLNDENILKLIGVCFTDDVSHMVTEVANKGKELSALTAAGICKIVLPVVCEKLCFDLKINTVIKKKILIKNH